jgi:hypothetical protein
MDIVNRVAMKALNCRNGEIVKRGYEICGFPVFYSDGVTAVIMSEKMMYEALRDDVLNNMSGINPEIIAEFSGLGNFDWVLKGIEGFQEGGDAANDILRSLVKSKEVAFANHVIGVDCGCNDADISEETLMSYTINQNLKVQGLTKVFLIAERYDTMYVRVENIDYMCFLLLDSD